MAKTIIQTIGPLYGEAVNGTVFGRPNGSVFVPSVNTIDISLTDAYHYIRSNSTSYFICNSAGSVASNVANYVHTVAESQDIANYVMFEIASDSEFTTILDDTIRPAGAFNFDFGAIIGYNGDGVTAIMDGDTYYFRARLMSSNGEPVATSATITLTGVSD